MTRIVGASGITVTVIADSVSSKGDRMTTMEMEYPRMIHSEILTHRLLSRNAASSRAIPVKSMIDCIKKSPAKPLHWGRNQAGMQAKDELTGTRLVAAKVTWWLAMRTSLAFSKVLNFIGLHKQISNRGTEAYQLMKSVVSATEWNNLLWLRNHKDAQPEFEELARCIELALSKSEPVLLYAGEWHLPYVETKVTKIGNKNQIAYLDTTGNEIDLDTARKISASCCAQVSYRRLNDSPDKAISIFTKLFTGSRVHASPVEHQSTPMLDKQKRSNWEEGVTHVDRAGNYWSGNLRGWVQYRKLIPNEAVW